MNQWKNTGPVIVGGIGGSGTRVIANILKEIGYYLGSDLNDALDNLWFTLLFKRSRWFFRQKNLHMEIIKGLSFFEKITKNEKAISFSEYLFLAKALREIIVHGHDHLGSGKGLWSLKRLKSMFFQNRQVNTEYIGWGWKEPNSHIYLEFLSQYFPDMKYIHVIRHGLDMAFSKNQAQLYNWGKLWAVEKPKTSEDIPVLSLEYWIKVNNTVRLLGEKLLGNRFCIVNFDQLQRNPYDEVKKLLKFTNHDTEDFELINRLCKKVNKANLMARYQQFDQSCFSTTSLNEVKKWGFQIETTHFQKVYSLRNHDE
ncbi:MAG: hypothetical protein APR62_13405 [Smithella sp. SDB]|nr:MAG: hypothetical protein APR62_13405 [Smithella sp. SDB]